jgi:hypothetical protein
MTTRFKFRDIPPGFGDRFPDGSYTVGRGADPRGRAAGPEALPAEERKPAKTSRTKKPSRTAAE